MAKRRIYDDELHAQFVTFHAIAAASCWITLGQGRPVGVPLGWVF